MSVSEPERRRAWVLSGGRCVICNKYLLEGRTSRELFLGELAHVVGQKDSAKSPRGVALLSQIERDSADNLMLLCADDHDEIDNKEILDLATVEWLMTLKREHEAAIKQATGFGFDRRSTVLRMVGTVRGQLKDVFRDTAATAVIRSGQRLPAFELAFDRHSIEIDLRQIPGEIEGTVEYYQAATSAIDRVIEHQFRDGVLADAIPHLSVFAFARWPLLVYLGTRLDDTVPTGLYQLHRSTEDWLWPESTTETVDFIVNSGATSDASEAVLILNVSGTIQPGEIPAELRTLPLYSITVSSGTPSPDAIGSREALANFEGVFRRFLAGLENTAKHVRLLHVLAAVPISAAITMGRVCDPNVQPGLQLYERAGDQYLPTLGVNLR